MVEKWERKYSKKRENLRPISQRNETNLNTINLLLLHLQVDEALTEADLIKLLAAVQQDSQICIDKLEAALSSNNLIEAKEQLIILRYMLSLENSIKEKGNHLGIVL